MTELIHPEEPQVRSWPVLLTGVIVLVIFMFIYIWEPRFLKAVFLQSQDTLIAIGAVPPQSGKVVLVDVDDESIASIGQWPWPRDLLAQISDRLWDAGASVIAYDIGFIEPDGRSPPNAFAMWREAYPDEIAFERSTAVLPDFDELFARSLSRGPSVLGFFINMVPDPVMEFLDEAQTPWRGAYVEKGKGRNNLPQGDRITAPITNLLDQAYMGFFNTLPDQDNIVRSTPLVIAVGRLRLYPSLALESVRLLRDAPRFGVYYDDEGVEGVKYVEVGGIEMPTDKNGCLTVNFRSGRFPRLRTMDVLSGAFNPDDVKGKIVIVGTSSVGLTDIYKSPLNEEIPGAEIHATVIDNVLAGDILSIPRWIFFFDFVAMIIGGLVLIALVTYARAVLSLLVLAFSMAYPVVISLCFLFYWQKVYVPTPLLLGWSLIYLGVTIMKYWQKEIIADFDARLRAVNKKLAQEIIVRTAAEREAQDARNAALRAAAAKSEFLANMSHEIRTPMNSVIGMTDLALRTILTDKQRNYLGKIRYSAHALLRLINDILDFSKLEAGKLTVENIEFNLTTVLDDISDLLGTQAHKKNIEFVVDCAPDVPRAVIGDPLRLRQVLINLAANAIKFTETGSVSVRVTAPRKTDERSDTHFEVIDTGIGLTPEQQGKLFQAFSQADSSTTRKYGGTGLGLAISQNLVQLMGGAITIASQAGEGSNFHFTLPYGRQSPEKEVKAALPEDLRNRRLLVASPAPVLRNLILRDCLHLGLRAERLPEGSALVAAVREAAASDPYAVVFLDTRMPEADALVPQLLETTAPDVKPPHVVLIGVPDMQRAPPQDPTSMQFLSKPLKSTELYSSLLIAFGLEPHPLAEVWQAAPTIQVAPDRLRHARVLLVDDNPINREVATENMIEFGILVESAVNGQEAYDKARSQFWNLILMDVQMPVMDGYESTRLIRQHEQQAQPPKPRTPIIAMTAHAMKEDEDRCREAGMDDYLSKPLEPDTFLAKLLQYIPQEAIPPCTEPAPVAPATPAKPPEPVPAKAPAKEHAPAPISLPNADVPAALRRLRGNLALYIRLLTDFASSHAGDPELLRQAVTKGEFEEARAIAHAIKGSAANLGLTEIQRLAAEIDGLFRRKDPGGAAALIEPLDQALQEFSKALAPHLPTAPQTAAEPEKPLDLPPELREQIAAIVADLRKGNVDALDRLAALRPALLQAGATPASLEHITQAAETFDFDKAALSLEKLAVHS